MFDGLQFVEGLESLTLRLWRQSFGKLGKLANNVKLSRLDLEGSLIHDNEACQISKLTNLTSLSVKSNLYSR